MSSSKRRRGSMIVDATIAMLAFVFILFASIDFGTAWWRCQALATAVLDGARYAILHGAGDPPDTIIDQAHVRRLQTYVVDHAWGLNTADQRGNFHWTTPAEAKAQPNLGYSYVEWKLPPPDDSTDDPNANPGSTVHIHAQYPLELALMKRFLPPTASGRCGGDAQMTIVRRK